MMQRLLSWSTSTRHRRIPRLASSLPRESTANLTREELRAIMTPSDVDLVVLTFNCAKAPVDPDIFGSHLCKAFAQNVACLPELVVLSLQEIAPLAYAFVGRYFLSAYLNKFTDAINFAASKFNDEYRVAERQQYTMVKSASVGMTAIMLFALDPQAIENIQIAETSFGTADIGNKGAVGLRFLYSTAGEDGEEFDGVLVERRETEMTFVAAHLAAMEWNLPIRNKNWRSIMSALLFENPRDILPEETNKEGPRTSETRQTSVEEADPLLESGEDDADMVRDSDPVVKQMEKLTPANRKRLHDSTIFKPSSHLFVAGDLNYRISTQGPEAEANFPSLNPASEHHHPQFFESRDQLMQEMAAGRTLHGMTEAPVNFPPTYKYTVLPKGHNKADPECNTDADGNKDAGEEAKVWWQFAGHRWPSWCDRVLYRDVPASGRKGEGKPSGIEVIAYDAMPVVKTSDHRPVFLRVKVTLIRPEDLAATADPAAYVVGKEGSPTAVVDTRAKLPVPVDRDAWVRRDAARTKEVALGWSMILWGTKEGAMVLVGGLAVAAGGWYLGGYFMG